MDTKSEEMFHKVPLHINKEGGSLRIERMPLDAVERLDNLAELVVFTPRGSFVGDPDFGFEYWNHEYANVNFREFNNGQETLGNEVTRRTCEDSIRDSIRAYEPSLKHIEVTMELQTITPSEQTMRKSKSKYEVVVQIEGELDCGLGTTREYTKTIRFFMEPTVKMRSL